MLLQTAAMQRAGRAGRTAPGKCYRLYTRPTHNSFQEDTVPEIMRSNLAKTVLYLKVLGVTDVLGFEFLDPPSADSIADGLKQLYLLGALDEDGGHVLACVSTCFCEGIHDRVCSAFRKGNPAWQ